VKPQEPEKPEPAPAPIEPAIIATDVEPAPAPAPGQKQPRPVPKAKPAKADKHAAVKEGAAAAAPPAPAPAPTPAAAATTGSLHVSSDPPTEISVDGKPLGVTPTSLELPVGSHRVELKEPRLGLSWGRSVEVAAGGRESLSWKPSKGLLDVRPVPPHVELQIAVDGVAVGPTPISAFSVWEGHRKVSAHNTATGWRTAKSIEVPPGGRVRVKVNDGSGIEVVAR
jgi:hypothetical protein